MFKHPDIVLNIMLLSWLLLYFTPFFCITENFIRNCNDHPAENIENTTNKMDFFVFICMLNKLNPTDENVKIWFEPETDSRRVVIIASFPGHVIRPPASAWTLCIIIYQAAL